jgi:prevent-host-death family protein
MNTHTWTVAQAKARFSEVIDKAQSDGPQTITRSGRAMVVIVAVEESRKETKHKGTLADFFAASPLRSSGLKIARLRGCGKIEEENKRNGTLAYFFAALPLRGSGIKVGRPRGRLRKVEP